MGVLVVRECVLYLVSMVKGGLELARKRIQSKKVKAQKRPF